MRSSGVLESSGGLGPHDHLCWGYDGHASFSSGAIQFIAEGVELGQRSVYVGTTSSEELTADLAGLDGLDQLIDTGRVTVTHLAQTYGPDKRRAVDQAAAYAAMTTAAIDAGFTGLRVVADATELVVDPGMRDLFVRYEHRIDRLMAQGLPFSAVCGYDRSRLDDDAIAELACVHPLVQGSEIPFRLHAGGGELQLAGVIEAWHESTLARAFDRVLASEPDQIVIDCSDLDFVHHRGLIAMDEAARDAGRELQLVSVPPSIARIIHLLDLTSVCIDNP